MAEGQRTQFVLGALKGGLSEALDYGSSSKATGNTQQFNERQPPTETQARSVQSPPRMSGTYLGIGAAVVGLVVILALVRR